VRRRWPALAAALLLAVIGLAGAAFGQDGDAAKAGSLRAVLGALAARHGIAMHGLETVDDQPAPAAGGTPLRRVEVLLDAYNYMLVKKPGGGVASVLIMGRKTKIVPPPESIDIETSRRGAHHIVMGILTGADGDRVTVPMIVDTGASTIVLPSSLIARLGFDAEALADGLMETANRRVKGKRAILASVEIGAAVQRDVRVTFIEDDRLGGAMLLGMSFLGRYRLTIDDAENRITLSNAR
jgi:aspartyl protease family protein